MPQEPQDASIIILDSIKKAKTDIVNAINAIVVSGGAGLISITYANLMLKIAGSTLSPGSFYKITDRGDVCLIFQSISVNQLAVDGIRVMLCPSHYDTIVDAYGNNWLGIWQPTLNPVIGDLVIWGGIVWHNATGNVGTDVTDIALSNDWQQWSKTSWFNHEYIEMIFGCCYDWPNDNITKQWDSKGNVFSFDPSFDAENNCSISDWNMSSNISILFYNNTCRGVYNNIQSGSPIGIHGNKNSGIIAGNLNGGVIKDNSNIGNITLNVNAAEISYNSNIGHIHSNSNAGNIFYNSNKGDITSNSNGDEISYNSNAGHIKLNTTTSYITLNSNTGQITSNSCGDIEQNTNSGYIVFNANSGILSFNSNNGDITNNTSNVEDIAYNSNGGYITGNSNGGAISNNNNAYHIYSNSNDGDILLNGNNGNIFQNSNAGTIERNSNNLHIFDNTNDGDIRSNSNLGSIDGNSNLGTISSNANNGNISTCSSGANPCNVEFNTNNGIISGIYITNVSDPVVNK
jgi:hypothetical protein